MRGEMAQQSRVLADLENLGSIPSTHVEPNNQLAIQLQFQEIQRPQLLPTRGAQTCMHAAPSLPAPSIFLKKEKLKKMAM